jgi:outer membrane protein assembly factor BamE (lipoprotein component of BamABCDE complex)
VLDLELGRAEAQAIQKIELRMKWLALFSFCIFSFALSSCQKKAVRTKSENSNTFCADYFKFIKDNFHPNSIGIYDHSDLFPLIKEEQTAKYRNEIINQCLIGKTKEEIISIFGKPSFSSLNRLDYYFNGNCSEKGVNPKSPSILRCVRLKIYLSNEGIVTGIPKIINE